MSSSNRRTRHIALALCAFAALIPNASAQDLEFSVSSSPVGSGARAAGMADAFVAIADDATAASWNPAGLIQLEEPEISAVWSFNGVRDNFHPSPGHPEVASRHNVNNQELNFLSAVYPLPFLILGRNAAISLSYQRKYDFSRKFDMDFDSSTPIRGVVRDTFQDVAFEQTGGLSTISPAFAIELTRRLSIGATVNLWRSSLLGDNGWTRDSNNSFRVEHPLPGTDILPDLGISRTTNIDATLDIDETYRDFKAANVTLGLLWTPTDRLSLGLRYDSSFTEKVKYRAKVDSRQFRHPDDAAPNGILDEYTFSGSERQKVRFPSFFALGAAFRANDRLILAMSITRADWDDSTLEDGSGTRVSLVDGSENGTEDDINFSPTYTVRLGAEYVFIPKEKDETLNRLWSVGGGAFFDQEPASGKSAGDANGDPEEFYGVTAGVGLLLNQRINIDAAYQFCFGKDVNKDFIRGLPGGFSEDVYQHRFLLSTIIYFGG